MSRSGYSFDYDGDDLVMYRGQVASAIRGRRGQRLLVDLVKALDALPAKRLITEELESEGEVCALGAVGRLRGVDMSRLDPEDPDAVAGAFDIATQLAREVTYINDEEGFRGETPEERFKRVRAWAEAQIRK
jgi:hypothetical protein